MKVASFASKMNLELRILTHLLWSYIILAKRSSPTQTYTYTHPEVDFGRGDSNLAVGREYSCEKRVELLRRELCSLAQSILFKSLASGLSSSGEQARGSNQETIFFLSPQAMPPPPPSSAREKEREKRRIGLVQVTYALLGRANLPQIRGRAS